MNRVRPSERLPWRPNHWIYDGQSSSPQDWVTEPWAGVARLTTALLHRLTQKQSPPTSR